MCVDHTDDTNAAAADDDGADGQHDPYVSATLRRRHKNSLQEHTHTHTYTHTHAHTHENRKQKMKSHSDMAVFFVLLPFSCFILCLVLHEYVRQSNEKILIQAKRWKDACNYDLE